jgi:hypothetical protein
VFSTNALTFPLLHLHILNLNWKYPKPFILERRKSFSFTNHPAAYSESQPEISKTFHIETKKAFLPPVTKASRNEDVYVLAAFGIPDSHLICGRIPKSLQTI